MAHPRANSSLLEQSRRRWRTLKPAVGVIVGGALLLGLLWPRPKPAVLPISAIPSPHGRVMVEVLNGTRQQGAARTATRMLRHQGLDVVFLGNADSVADSTRVIVRRGDLGRARYVAQALGAGKVVVETDTFRRVDVSVILGDDFRPKLPLHP